MIGVHDLDALRILWPSMAGRTLHSRRLDMSGLRLDPQNPMCSRARILRMMGIQEFMYEKTLFPSRAQKLSRTPIGRQRTYEPHLVPVVELLL